MVINNIKRHFKFHPTATVLIIISYIISIVFISLGISFLNEKEGIRLDNHTGDPEKQLMLNIEIGQDFEFDKFISYIINDTYQYDIKISSTAKIGSNDIVIIGHKYDSKPLWKPNLLSGSYFNNKDYDNKNIAVVGKNLESSCFWEAGRQYITINKEKYLVTGIMGRENREVMWNRMIYLPIECMETNLLNKLTEDKQINLLVTSKKIMTILDKDSIMNDFTNRFKNITITNIYSGEEKNNSSVQNVVLISILIFIVSIVNVMAMTLFWIIDRRKEIAVRKVLGFTNEDIINLIIKEMISIGILAVFCSIIIQLVLNIAINSWLNMNLVIKMNNLIISIIVVLVSVFITSIAPIKIILKIKLTEILN